jgi:electron transfer flavoprotein beta subunit
MMNIAVCVKQILDPEMHLNDFQVDRTARKVVEGKAQLVMNPYDENAIEVALQVRSGLTAARAIALTLGGKSADKVLRRALGMGCDDAIWLKDPSLEDLDSFGIAKVLAKGIRKMGDADLVLCGRQAGDWDMSQVGYLLAEELSLPCVSGVYNMEPKNGMLSVHRESEGAMETLEVKMPFLALITNHSSNVPRLPTVSLLTTALRKKLPVWSCEDLDMHDRIPRWVTLEDLYLPAYDNNVEIIDGEDGAEKGKRLVQRLFELKLI